MPFVPLIPKGSAPPLAPYSPGTAAGDAIYVSGTLALDKEGRLVGKDDVRVQARRASDYAAVNEVYKEFFPGTPPARWCIICELVKPEFLVEISSIAYR